MKLIIITKPARKTKTEKYNNNVNVLKINK